MVITSAWLRANKKIADAKHLDLQIQELQKEIERYDDNDPKNWDLLAVMSKSLVEKEKRLADINRKDGE